MSDDKIGGVKIDIKKLIDDCILTNRTQQFNRKDFEDGVYYEFDDPEDEIDPDVKEAMEKIKFEKGSNQQFWITIEQEKDISFSPSSIKLLAV